MYSSQKYVPWVKYVDHVVVFVVLLIGEQGEVLEGEAFLARKLLKGEPPVKPVLPLSGRYRLDNALLRLLLLPWRCLFVCKAATLAEDKFESAQK